MSYRKLPSLGPIALTVALIVGVFAAAPASATPATFTVNVTGDQTDATLDGTCDVDTDTGGPQCTLRGAIAEANNTTDLDTVQFATGLGTIVLNQGLLVTEDLSVDGRPDETVIDGNGLSNPGGIFTTDLEVALTLQSMTLQNAKSQTGAALYGISSDFTIDDVHFIDNSATDFGGAIYELSGTLTITDSTFAGNTALEGGAISTSSALNTPDTYFNVTFTDNTATGDTTSGRGGAISYDGDADFTQVTFTGNSAGTHGGAIYLYDGDPTFTDVTFSGNSAPDGKGGAVYLQQASPRIDAQFIDTIFDTNTAGSTETTGSGGAIYAHLAETLMFVDGRFTDNQAIATEAELGNAEGGAIYAIGAAPFATDSMSIAGTLFESNHVDGRGGAIWADIPTTIESSGLARARFLTNSSVHHGGAIQSMTGDLSITNALFDTNQTESSGGAIEMATEGDLTMSDSTLQFNTADSSGGALSFAGDTATIEDSTFHGNDATQHGGAIEHHNSGLPGLFSIVRSTFSSNTAGVDGGAINSGGEEMNIDSSTLSGNAAGYGGAIYQGGSPLEVTNSTIASNTATNDAGAIAVAAMATITNSALHDNRVGAVPSACSSSAISDGYNFDGDGTCLDTGGLLAGDVRGTTTTPLNAKLAPLADNGGATLTRKPMPGSPLIDRGSPALTCPSTDQRGVARPIDGDGNGTKACDKGSVEAPVLPPKLTVKGVKVKEGDRGLRRAVFRVSLSYAFAKTVSVRLKTAKGTAKSPSDFRAKSARISFAPGQRTKTFVVRVKGDRKKERRETFFVKLSAPVNARLVLLKAKGIIVNDD
jgi:predicted outer membrane repeat protein